MYVVFQVFRKILVNIMDMYIRDVHIMFEVERNLYRVENYSGIIMINLCYLKVYKLLLLFITFKIL